MNQTFAFMPAPPAATRPGPVTNGLGLGLGPIVIEFGPGLLGGLGGLAGADPCADLRQRNAQLESTLSQLNAQLVASRLDAAQTRQQLVAAQEQLRLAEQLEQRLRQDLVRQLTQFPPGTIRG